MSELVVFNQWVPVDGCGTGGGALLPFSEPVAVTDVNVFAPLSQTPYPSPITLTINGRSFFNVGNPPDFRVIGNTITWESTLFSVSPVDDVIASYYYVL
jgi:hypothetical protein